MCLGWSRPEDVREATLTPTLPLRGRESRWRLADFDRGCVRGHEECARVVVSLRGWRSHGISLILGKVEGRRERAELWTHSYVLFVGCVSAGALSPQVEARGGRRLAF